MQEEQLGLCQAQGRYQEPESGTISAMNIGEWCNGILEWGCSVKRNMKTNQFPAVEVGV